MIRTPSLAAALAAGLTLPALAVGPAVKVGTETIAGRATQILFTSDQARQHLMQFGSKQI